MGAPSEPGVAGLGFRASTPTLPSRGITGALDGVRIASAIVRVGSAVNLSFLNGLPGYHTSAKQSQ